MKEYTFNQSQGDVHLEDDGDIESPQKKHKNLNAMRIIGLGMWIITLILVLIDGYLIYGLIVKCQAMAKLQDKAVIVDGRIIETHLYGKSNVAGAPSEFIRAYKVSEKPVFTVEIEFDDLEGVSHKVERYAFTKSDSNSGGARTRNRGSEKTYRHRFDKGDIVKVAYNPDDIDKSAFQVVSRRILTRGNVTSIIIISFIVFIWGLMTLFFSSAIASKRKGEGTK